MAADGAPVRWVEPTARSPYPQPHRAWWLCAAGEWRALDRQVTDPEVLSTLHAAFANCERPEHFTNFEHCCECAEHDELLRSRDRGTLQIEDVGNAGWDPLCFTSGEGLLYYLPALGRLALQEPTGERDWYVPQLHFHLTYEDKRNRILVAASAEQKRAVVHLLRHILDTRAELCERWSCRDDLLAAAELWER